MDKLFIRNEAKHLVGIAIQIVVIWDLPTA